MRAVDIMRNWEVPNRHYHAGMAAGENTFNAHTARVLMRSIVKTAGRYDRDAFTCKQPINAATNVRRLTLYAHAFNSYVQGTISVSSLQLACTMIVMQKRSIGSGQPTTF